MLLRRLALLPFAYLESSSFMTLVSMTDRLIFNAGLVLAALILPTTTWAEEQDIVDTDPGKAAESEKQLISRARQITYQGRRAGEGYFSADGQTMIFQSERYDGNPFFQIYELDLGTGRSELVSPGLGKTTCAWLHPNQPKVLFASTQDDPDATQEQQEELDLRASGKERRYSWDYDPFYDLYEYNKKDETYHNLTKTEGYDAEGSYSPDGKLIAFASNRSAYTEELTEKQRKVFEKDPAWANEIYVMNADGSDVRRLTNSPGYDGGPFFSADGKSICFRRFSENGLTAEIMTMDLDGSNKQTLTKMGVMSWAPYFHPSGEYLIYTTNVHGFKNFELYLVDRKGEHAPVRVTHTAGFDGLPVFSPDGKQISWTSNRTANNKSQIFLAEWNHTAAMKKLGRTTTVSPPQTAAATSDKVKPSARSEFAPADAVRHVEYLCRPQLKGRLTGTRGEKLATNYVALYLETLGLEPAGDAGTWFQEFEFTSGVSTGQDNVLKMGDKTYEVKTDYSPVAFSQTGDFGQADVVFAGYGIQAPAGDGFDEYDSYVHLDVKDKWVMCFRFMPEGLTAERRQYLNRFSSLRFKAMRARDLGAKGLIVVSGPTSGVKRQLVPLRFDGSLSGTSLGIISITDEVASQWMASVGQDLKSIQEKLDTGEPAMGWPVKGISLTVAIDVQQETKTGRNVLGRLQVDQQMAHEVVVVGAHIDHLGASAGGNSLARDDESDEIHFGADDNASGVAAMLQMAEALAGRRDAGTLKADRDIIFAAWSGEELGLLGSTHYVNELEKKFSQHAAAVSGPADNKDANSTDAEATDDEVTDSGATKQDDEINTGGLHLYIAACLNMDMVGRLQEKLVLQGIGSSNDWKPLIEQINVSLGIPLTLQDDSYIPTDASVFFLHGVPILSAFTGNHGEYHTPRDTPEKLNYEGISEVAKLMTAVCVDLVGERKMPKYVMQEKPKNQELRASLRAYLGTVPDYVEPNIKGVLLSGVAKNGPASKAGIKGGDIIVEVAGKKIENIYDYTYAIEALKIGQEITIVVQRNAQRVNLKVIPGSRD